MSNDTDAFYSVVFNDEGQYSIWPAGKTMPFGWSATDICASRNTCINLISHTWMNMRPESLKAQLNRPHDVAPRSGINHG
jgi:MbtH protein